MWASGMKTLGSVRALHNPHFLSTTTSRRRHTAASYYEDNYRN
jgi:hypothetical protein